MSSTDLYRNPTWISLFPRAPVAVTATPEVIALVEPHLPEAGTLRQLEYAERPSDHLIFEGASSAPLFLKIIGERSFRRQREADEISAWVAMRGVSTIRPTAGFPRRLNDDQRLFAYSYLECEPLLPCDADMAGLGRELALLHTALAHHPSRCEWEAATRVRLEHLLDIRRRLAAESLRAGPRPDELASLACDESLDFERVDLPAMPLHGDLNAGNIRRLTTSGRPLLLDFEDTFHSVLPVAFELGLIFERIVLVAIHNDLEARHLLHVLLHSYRSHGGQFPISAEAGLGSIVRSLSLRSLCVLTSCELAGIPIDECEWSKFFDLAEMAAARPLAFDAAPTKPRAGTS